mmetsp:Transcript_19726/g.29279  ORF Transcript_19726/g.29279 Transcript_19726/m.29279 type:complete len:454 (-) Transcript_19726:936-2297(-)
MTSFDGKEYPCEMLLALASGECNERNHLVDDCNNAVENFFSVPSNEPKKSDNDEIISAVSKTSKHFQSSLLLQEEKDASFGSLSGTLRCIKNLLRWCLQTEFSCEEDVLAETLQSLPILTRYNEVLLITVQREMSTSEETEIPSLQRFATLCLLYSTFNSKERCQYVITELSYLKTSVSLLVKTDHTAVILGTLRLWHSFLVQVPGFRKDISELCIETRPCNTAEKQADWLKNYENYDMTTLQLLSCIAKWYVHGHHLRKEDPRVSEIVHEILRIFYVVKAASQLDQDLIKDLLAAENEFQLGTILMLMDMEPPALLSLANTKDDEGKRLFERVFFPTLERQVSLVVEETIIGSKAASALTPVLVVMQQLCKASQELRKETKEKILLSKESRVRKHCLQCLTWIEPHVKRCMGELLWTLCEESAQEYKLQVGGIGNAWPMMAARGLVQNVPGS